MTAVTNLTNLDLVELLSRASMDAETDRRAKALARASRHALLWEEEAAELMGSGRPLTELAAVGPWIGGILQGWLEDPPEVSEPPDTRRGFRTMSMARRVLDEQPERRSELRADLQTHSEWSDGKATLEENARAALALGHSYLLATDHSAGQRIPPGMNEEAILRQREEIDRVNDAVNGVRVLQGIEMNLDVEGRGDTDPTVLAGLDVVLAAFHSKLRIEEDQTERYLAAVRNPDINVLAHPRGRRFGARVGLRADWPRVFAAAAEAGTALETDAHPDRQDLDVELLEVARDEGVWLSIGSDAHRPDEMRWIDLGVAAAAAAGFPRERILNSLSADDLVAWAAERRARAP